MDEAPFRKKKYLVVAGYVQSYSTLAKRFTSRYSTISMTHSLSGEQESKTLVTLVLNRWEFGPSGWTVTHWLSTCSTCSCCSGWAENLALATSRHILFKWSMERIKSKPSSVLSLVLRSLTPTSTLRELAAPKSRGWPRTSSSERLHICRKVKFVSGTSFRQRKIAVLRRAENITYSWKEESEVVTFISPIFKFICWNPNDL